MMSAHCGRAWSRLGCLFALALLSVAPCQAGTYQTRNFIVHAPTQEVAEEVGRAAEMFRRELAIQWLGKEMPNWTGKCPIQVKIGQIGAGGATTFNFGGGHVYGWKMNVQGTLERVLDSVLPHEISHTIFACHFRCPLPRWADEGAATLAEHDSEKKRQDLTVREVIDGNRMIPLRKLMSMKEYPTDMRDVMTLYAEGYSLAELLVQQAGRERYLLFLRDAMQNGWDAALVRHYGYKNVEEFEKKWLGWVMAGSPEIDKNVLYASRSGVKPVVSPVKDGPPAIVRGQNSEEERSRTAVAVVADPMHPKRMTPATPLGSDVSAPPPKRGPAEYASIGEPDPANLREDGPIERPAAPRATPKTPKPDIAELETDPRTAVKTAELTPEFDWKRNGSDRPGSDRPGSEPESAPSEADREVILEGETDRAAGSRGNPPPKSRGTGPRMLARATIIPTDPDTDPSASGATPPRQGTSRPAASPRSAVRVAADRTTPARRKPSFSEAPVEPGYRPLATSR